MRKARNILLQLIYSVYLYFAYHLLVVTTFAEFSFYGLLVVPFMLGVFWLIPAEHRKYMLVYTLMFLFIDQAIVNIAQKVTPMFYLWAAFIGLFLYPIVRLYAKIRLPAVIIALVLALSLNAVLPERMVLALPHLYPKWSSEKLYIGDVTQSLPVAAVDIDGDGHKEIITLGNKDFYPDGLREARFGYHLVNEPLHLIVWNAVDGKLERVPNEQLDAHEVRALLPKDFVAFPYYVLNDELVLEPLVQRQPLTEAMMRYGDAPYRALQLNLANIIRHFEMNGYVYDRMEQSGSFEHLLLQDGNLYGTYEGTDFSIPSPASKIIGAIQLEDGQEGLLVLGLDVELLQFVDGDIQVTHTLTREMQNNLAQADFITHDINGDGFEEFIVTYPFPSILEPVVDGRWNILWSAGERSFNIKDVGSFSDGGETEILALRKSAVRANDVNYLTSYSYHDQKLEQNWKIFMRNIDTAVIADVTGDSSNELITTIYGKQRLFVWGKHNVPVTGLLIGITALIVVGLVGRRVFDAKQLKAK